MNALGHSSPAFCHDPIRATAAKIEQQGFQVWEVVGEGGHDPWEHRREFKAALADHPLRVQVHAPLSDANLASLVDPFWELSVRTVERALEGAHAIGATTVTVHPGNHTPLSRGHYDALHERARKAVARLDRTGRDLGLTLCLENMPTGWAFETDSLGKLLDLVQGTSFKLCYDVAHAHVAQRSPEFDAAAGRIGNVHLSDNRGDHDAHLTLGEGTAPWASSVRLLRQGGYRGAFVVESRAHGSGEASLARLRTALKD